MVVRTHLVHCFESTNNAFNQFSSDSTIYHILSDIVHSMMSHVLLGQMIDGLYFELFDVL